MILATARGGNREYRTDFGSSAIPSYASFLGSSAGVNLTLQAAAGVPTVGACIRLLAETIGSMPVCVYQGERETKREADASWQYDLLYKQPNPDCSPFDFFSDIASSVESCGNAFVRKFKSRGRVVALYVLDPTMIVVKRGEGNTKIFELHDVTGTKEILSAAQVLHVRGFTLSGGDVGLSPIAQFRTAFSSALAAQEFQANFYKNDATPPAYMSVPGPVNREQGLSMMQDWNARHQGPRNKGNLAILFNGAEIKQLGMPMSDAQWIETQARSDELAARIYLGPAASLMSGPANVAVVKTEEETLRYMNFAVRPRLSRIEGALRSDLDLFGGTDLYPEFHIDDLLRADAATRAEVQHKQIQSGALLIDEARAEEGRPPLPDGMGQIPQLTPVGGAPNPALTPAQPKAGG